MGCADSVTSVIGASAILAYLFLPFENGTKPPCSVVACYFVWALAAVSAARLTAGTR